MSATMSPAEARGFGQYLDYNTAARYLAVSPRFLSAAKARGDLPAVRLGRRVVFARADLDAYASSQKMWDAESK